MAAAQHGSARHADVVAVGVSLTRGNVGPPRAARRRRLALRSAQPRRSGFCRRSSRRRRRGRSSRGRVRLWRRRNMAVLGTQTWSQSALVSHEPTSARRVLRVVVGWRCARRSCVARASVVARVAVVVVVAARAGECGCGGGASWQCSARGRGRGRRWSHTRQRRPAACCASSSAGAALGAAASLGLLSSLESPSSSWSQLARASAAVAAAQHGSARHADVVAVGVSLTRANVGPPRAARRRRLALRSAQPRRSGFCRRSSRRRRRGRSSRGRVRLWRRRSMAVLGTRTWSRSALVSHEPTSARRVLRVVVGWRCARRSRVARASVVARVAVVVVVAARAGECGCGGGATWQCSARGRGRSRR